MTDLLKRAYDPEHFREQAHKLADLLADHLAACSDQTETTVLPWMEPDERLLKWQDELINDFDFAGFWQQAIDDTIHIRHPKYMGHQVSTTIPLSGLGDMINGALNNGSAIYEMGPVSTAMERIVTDWLARAIGYGPESSGVLTSGGSLGNLTAMLAARQHKSGFNYWNEGNKPGFHPAVMVSEESHYSIARAIQIMGWGDQGIVKVPSTPEHKMDVSRLEELFREASQKGLTILALVGNACSTSTGIYDDLESQAEFCERHNLWFHIDGAHGGAAAITPDYRYLTKGIERADSIVIDFHKMLGVSALTTAVLFRESARSYDTFNQKAAYILHDVERELWYNSAVRTLECTKNMMGIKVYAILKTYGPQIFVDYLSSCYALGRTFARLIKSDPDFDLPYEPESNIVCFRIVREGLDILENNTLIARVRQRIIEDGRFYIVQTAFGGVTYLRTSLMNPFTTVDDMQELLHEVKRVAAIL
jgi:L-2,4-diaminobutyrate decarboxylase